MLERDLEGLFRQLVKRAGGVIHKLDARARKGSPDRVVTLPGRPTFYVELKTERGRLSPLQQKGRLSPLQQKEIDDIISAGGNVRVLYGERAVRGFVSADT